MHKINKKYPITIGLLLAVAALALIFLPKQTAGDMLDEVQLTDSTEVKEIVYRYGIPTDDYDVDYGIVKQGQNLSYILADHGLSHQQVHRVNEKATGVFDVRKIRARDRPTPSSPPATACRRLPSWSMRKTPKPTWSSTCGATALCAGVRIPRSGGRRK